MPFLQSHITVISNKNKNKKKI